jgi:hypothetical protein
MVRRGFGAKKVIDGAGPLPLEGTYTSNGGTLIIMAAGSGFRSAAFSRYDGPIGMSVKVDGQQKGVAEFRPNARDIHSTFVSDYIVVEDLPAAAHTIRLEALYYGNCNTPQELHGYPYCTTTNFDDHFHATVIELPN